MEKNTSDSVLALLRDEYASGPVAMESTFEEMGLDSLDFACLLQDIRQSIGNISDADAVKAVTVQDLISAIC